MNLDRLLVYWVKVVKNEIKPDPLGGEIEMSDEIRAIFKKSFLGNEKGGQKIQPFHFNLGGQIRNNDARDRILNLLKDSRADLNLLGLEMATELQKLVDDRIGDLLLAIGLGWIAEKKAVRSLGVSKRLTYTTWFGTWKANVNRNKKCLY